MNKNLQNYPEQEKEALRFLVHDFNQCFEQMRHYDTLTFNILKFMFTAYSALIGVSIGFYQFGLQQSKDLSSPAIAVLIIGLILGLLMFAIIVHNRVYYIQVARYINEQRGFFIKVKPMGFENKSRMYVDCELPSYFNWRSSYSLLCYIIAVLNSTLLGVLLYIIFPNSWIIVIGGWLVLCKRLINPIFR